MRIWQRLVAIVVAFSVPLAVLLYFFYDTAAFRRDFARKEREGNEVLRPLQRMLGAATELRTLGARFAADPRAADRIVAMRGRIGGLLVEVERLQEKPGLDGPYGDGFDVRALFAEAEAAWRELAAASPPEAPYDDARHARFVDAVRAVLSRVGDKSNLILDPDLDSYYAMDFVLLRAPAFVTGRGDLVRHAEAMIRRGVAEDRRRAELIAELGIHRSNVEGAKQAFAVAFRENRYYAATTGTMRPALERPLADFAAAELALVDAIEAGVTGAAPTLGLGELESLREAASTAFDGLYDASSSVLDRLVDARLDDAVGRRDRVLVVVYAIFLASLGLVALIARSITRPLAAGVAAARRISAGELDANVEITTADEIAELLKAMNAMTESLRRMIANESGGRRRIERLVDEIGRSASEVATASDDILATTREQSATARDQAAAVSETAATAEELSRSARLVNERAEGFGATAARAAAAGEGGRSAVMDAVTAMDALRARVEATAEHARDLADRARLVDEIVATVSDIADQTNLLALNAAIEASRAQAGGRGFSVVAAEIKQLAGQSKDATLQVRKILGEIQKGTEGAKRSTEEVAGGVVSAAATTTHAGEVIRNLVETLGEAVRAATEITASSREQATAIAQINQAIRHIDDAARRSVDSAKQSESAVASLRELGRRLAAMTTEGVEDGASGNLPVRS